MRNVNGADYAMMKLAYQDEVDQLRTLLGAARDALAELDQSENDAGELLARIDAALDEGTS